MTALALYKKYLELKESDSLIEALNGLYDHGKQCNWKTPEQTEEEEMVLQQLHQQLSGCREALIFQKTLAPFSKQYIHAWFSLLGLGEFFSDNT